MKIRIPFCSILAAAALSLCGCSDDASAREAAAIRVRQGEGQCALAGQEFAKPLRIELLGPVEGGILGGKGSRHPAANVKVTFRNSEGSDLVLARNEGFSDIAGSIELKVSAGKKLGDHYLIVTAEGTKPITRTIRYTVGAELSGNGHEGYTGQTLDEPISIKLADASGNPVPNVPVYFRVASGPAGARSQAAVSRSEVRTGADGVAETGVKLGDKTGEYQIAVEVADPAGGLFMRTQNVKVLGINLFNVIITVLGGLAIFVLGMKVMSDGLQKVAGDSMKRLLQFFAGNTVVAVIAGALVTAVIQSSSATTVMVIGFINAGLLNLTQAIGIIFGANIGTTITAQIISFNLSGLALPAITAGLLVSFSKRRILSGWGESVLGFGLLFFGMSMMSNELKILGEFRFFKDFFQLFDCAPHAAGEMMPLGAVLGALGIGTAMTVMVQSSSAAMGIVLALSAGNLINFYTAIPLLLGTNIGTTVTAFLASLAANRVAKQAALAHTLFNVIGSVIMILLFYVPVSRNNIPVFLYLVNECTPGNVFAAEPQNIERHIAMAHTLFNMLNVILLLPFIGLFVKLCTKLLPVHDEKAIRIQMLEPYLLNTPSVALEQTVYAIRAMVRGAWSMIDRSVNEHFVNANVDRKKFGAIEEEEEGIDTMQREVTDYLVRITRQQLTEPQSALVPLLMHCTNDAERVADHAETILQLTERLSRLDKKLSEQGRKDLRKMWSVLDEQAQNVVKALSGTDSESIGAALKAEQKLHKLAARFERDHVERLRHGHCSVSVGVIYIELLGELEKIGNHLSNIAERATEIQKHYIKL